MDQKSLEILKKLKSDMRNKEIDERKAAERARWITSKCKICRSEFAYLPEWRPVPVLCTGCRNERRTRYKTGGTKNLDLSKNYTHVSVFRGGSPGGGRNK